MMRSRLFGGRRRMNPHGLALAVILAALTAAEAACGQTPTPRDPRTHTQTSTGEVVAPRSAAALASYAPIVRSVTPAVVSIESEFSAATAARMEGQDQGQDQEMPQLPPGFPPGLIPQPGPRGPVHASGSGFIVSSDGYILTNNHVVADAQRVNVTLVDRRIYKAKVVGRDPSTDVALIKIDGSGFPTLTLGDDANVQVGDAVLAIGNPFGLEGTVTSGIVSAKERGGSLAGLFNSRYAVVDFLQTDAVINPGNSGGPLIDMQGRVIGINSAIASPTGTYAGYGFAIPISIAKAVMSQIQKYGHVRRAILGVSIQDVTPTDAQAAGMNEIRGALVGGFSNDNSPAKRAGLQPGDIITAINGQTVDRVAQLQRMLLSYQPAQKIDVTVQRFGKQLTLPLTLGELPADQQVASNAGANPTSGVSNGRMSQLGIAVTPVTPDIAGQLQLPNGTNGLAVMSVDPNGPAAGLLVPQDVITAVLNGGQQRPVRSPGDLQQALTSSRGVLSLLVYNPQAGGTRVVNIGMNR